MVILAHLQSGFCSVAAVRFCRVYTRVCVRVFVFMRLSVYILFLLQRTFSFKGKTLGVLLPLLHVAQR